MWDWASGPHPEPLDSRQLESLRGLVARLRAHEGPWGEWDGGERVGPREFTMPFMDMGDLAHAAMKWMYDNKRIYIFEWGEWDEGRRIFQEWNAATAAALDHLTVRKLITAIARNDRFNEGAWVGMFEDGYGVPLFSRLLELEDELAAGTDS